MKCVAPNQCVVCCRVGYVACRRVNNKECVAYCRVNSKNA
jgi:hypothetical protein